MAQGYDGDMLRDYRCFIFYDRSALILNEGWGTTARKSYADMLNNYVEGLHREGSKAVFGEEGYRV